MNPRASRGPMLLILASIFVVFALIAYLVGAVQERIQRNEAIRAQLSQRTREEQWNQERVRFHAESEQSHRERVELLDRYKRIMQLLDRIETLVKPASK